MKLTARTKGILLMILSEVSMAMMSVAVKKTGGAIPVFEQVFFRNVVIVLVVGTILILQKKPLMGPAKYQLPMFGRSLFGIVGVVLSFLATAAGNTADVTILSKLAPFLITLFGVLFLKEKLSKIQIPALLLAFTGAFVVANPKFNTDMYPVVMALLCSVVSSVAYTLVSYLKGKAEPRSIVMHLGVVSVALMIPAMLLTDGFVMPAGEQWIWLLLIGVFGTAGQVCLTYAYKLAAASEVSVFSNTSIIFAAVLGYLLLDQSVALNTVIGGGLVLLAVLLVYLFGHRKKKEQA